MTALPARRWPAAMLAVAGLCSTAVRSAEDALPAGAIELEDVAIVDLDLTTPERTAILGWMLAPKGWKGAPGARWHSRDQCTPATGRDAWTVSEPDGSASVALLPTETWIVGPPYTTKFRACGLRRYDDAESFTRDLLGRLHPKSTVKNVRLRDDVAGDRKQSTWNSDGSRSWRSAVEVDFETPDPTHGLRAGRVIADVRAHATAPAIPEHETSAYSAMTFVTISTPKPLAPVVLEAMRQSLLFDEQTAHRHQMLWERKITTRADWARRQKEHPERFREPPQTARPLMPPSDVGGIRASSTWIPGVWRTSTGRYFLLPANSGVDAENSQRAPPAP